MKLTLKALAQAARRLSVQVMVVGSGITAATTQTNAILSAAHAVLHSIPAALPQATQDQLTGAALLLTTVGSVIASVVPQKSVATYNPSTHDLTPKQPAPLDPPAGSEQ